MRPSSTFFYALDAAGAPILLERLDKTGTSVTLPVRSGNPFRDPGSGTFGNGPAGAKTDDKEGLLGAVSQPGKLYVVQMRNKTKADAVSVTRQGERVLVVMTKGGTQVAAFTLPMNAKPASRATQEAPASLSRDAVIDEARSDKPIGKLTNPARLQRIEDLVSYLYARYNASGAIFSKPGSVRVEAPAGWDKKTIQGLTDAELKDVAARMQARGWSDQAVSQVLLAHTSSDRRAKLTKESA